MRERLDCAVLLTQCTLDWMRAYLGPHSGGRLYLHACETVVDITNPGAHNALASSAMALRRHDVCLLPVRPATLSWARTSLAQVTSRLQTPVMALVQDLTTAGLYDLYELGVADFLRTPFCPHEARMRIERLLDGRRGAAASGANPARHQVAESAPEDSYGTDTLMDEICRNILSYDGPELDAYAMAAASRCATSSESFRDAKSKVIERFERAYITAALGRHGGNIAMAARSAQKHRRAFWALMRKHKIEAEPFRRQTAEPAIATAAGAGAAAKHPGGNLAQWRSPKYRAACGQFLGGKGKIG